MTASPHDALVKTTFSQVRHARPLIRRMLPPRLARAIRWSTMRLRPGSFIDDTLKDSHSDLLFSARTRHGEVLIYVLFEHQSTIDPWMPLRLLEYMCRIWRKHLLENPRAKRLPVVLPTVLHHSETGWTADTRFEALFDIDAEEAREELLHFIPRFDFALDDVSHATDDALRARSISALGKLALACLRHARDMPVLLGGLHAWKDTIREIRDAPHGVHAMKAVLKYMLIVGKMAGGDEVRRLVEKAGDPILTEAIMTTAEILREEGRRDGLAKGIAKGRADVLLRLLRVKFGKVPARTAARLQTADTETLDRWAERILTASRLAEVFEG